jgi:putative ABC transport system permease protein
MFLIDDLRHSWMALRKAPGFFALATGVLALGLASTIFMYGVVVTTIERPPPFSEPERLVLVASADPARGKSDGLFHYQDYLDLSARQRTFEGIAASNTGSITFANQGSPERLMGAWITSNFFSVLRVSPVLGRAFEPNDTAPNAAPVVIVSHDIWRTRMNADPDAIGRTVRINGRDTTLVGVAPAGFSFPFSQQAWMPIPSNRADKTRGSSGSLEHSLVGRLQDGVTHIQAADDLAAVAADLAKQFPATNGGLTTHLMPISIGSVGMQGSKLLYVVFGCVWLVLLIACANMASLTFVRANHRLYEAGVRAALGAKRGRLIGQMLTESVIISISAMLVGLALAALALRGLQIGLPAMLDKPLPAWWQFTVDGRVAVFALLAALVSALLAGIVPAFKASQPNVNQILRDGGRTGTGLRLSRFALAMVVAEVALSAVLLMSAGLLTRDALIALQRDIGVNSEGFMTGRIGVPRYPLPDAGRFYDRLAEDLRSQAGVQVATAASSLPGLGADLAPYAVAGQTYNKRSDMPRAQDITVLPGFFHAFGLSIVAGRDFDSRDQHDSLPVALVNRTFVHKYFPSGDPLGARINASADSNEPKWLSIVGVVPDVQHTTDWAPGGSFHPAVYVPASQRRTFLSFAVKGAGDPQRYANVLRESARRLDPDVAMFFVRTLPEQQAIERGVYRLLAALIGSFAVIAVVLAAVGIYGVLAYATAQRTREIGVRRALGARDQKILVAIMRGTGLQLGIGLVLAAVLCPLVPRLLSGALQGLPPDDGLLYGTVFTVIVLAVLVAGWIPARRALRVEPAIALRND